MDYPFLANTGGPNALGQFGEYRLLRVLGTGGMGIVFAAEDTRLGRHLALKIIRPELAGRSGNQARFLREARLAAAIRHEHIVEIWQAGEKDGIAYLTMPLLQGETLEARLALTGRLALSAALRLAEQIAAGLAAAHRAGLIHRDLKPANIWLESPEDRIRLLDFGLARMLDDDSGLTQSGTVLGTPAYLSPEQARGERLDERSDLFSFGCVLYRMLSGSLPFGQGNLWRAIHSLATADPQPISERVPELPPGLAELIMQLLSKDPHTRPASAAEVGQRLGSIRAGHISGAPPATRMGEFSRRQLAWAGLGAVLVTGPLLYLRSRPFDMLVPAAPPASSPFPNARWQLFREDSYDTPGAKVTGDERHRHGVAEGVCFEEIGPGQLGRGFVHRRELPGVDFAVEMRVRFQHATFSLRFRDVVDDRGPHYVECDFRQDGSWTLKHGFLRPTDHMSRETTYLLDKDQEPDPPRFREGEWVTLRLLVLDDWLRLEADGERVFEVRDEHFFSERGSVAAANLVVGLWSTTRRDTARLEIDSCRVWRPDALGQPLPGLGRT
ncbi:MAG: serine/threonine-protein kinase [Pirellulales bacterium]